jgi:myo-inositol-1(or 4)-monophosphatase
MKGTTDIFGSGNVVAGNELIQKALIDVVNRPVPTR